MQRYDAHWLKLVRGHLQLMISVGAGALSIRGYMHRSDGVMCKLGNVDSACTVSVLHIMQACSNMQQNTRSVTAMWQRGSM
jgi:hypothetical protein